MNFSSKLLSQTVVELCLAKELDHVVISPGSRNAPLTIGFTEHPDIKCYSVVDERCAAFFALGMAQQLKKPVAVVCTSGSAMLNYFPAVAEAFYSDIPLVVLSADRPAHLLEIGDGQTIQQEGVFGKHVLYGANCKEGDDYQIYNETEINIALNTAIELQGPVHVNLPFSEPLYHTVTTLQVHPQVVPVRAFKPEDGTEERIAAFLEKWDKSKKKLVIVGVLPPNSIHSELLSCLADDPSVLVFTETTSNLHHPNFIEAIDQLISSLDDQGFKRLQPEILLTFGGMVVSKRVKAFLRKYAPKTHWHVDAKKANDTYFSLTHHLKTRPATFLQQLKVQVSPQESDYRDDWLRIKAYRVKRHDEYLQQIPYSDFKVFGAIFKQLPAQVNVQLANSATVRYAQLFALPSQVKVFCNRGTSGIDGSTSTAVGAANVSNSQTILITGDLSFFYDSNALWNNYIPEHFRIIIVNNSGGGIFRILPGAKDAEHFKTYFETSHQLTAADLAKMYGFEYTSVGDEAALKDQLEDFFASSGTPKIMEVFTPSNVNDTVLLNYFSFIS